MRQTINTILAIGLLAFSGSVFAEAGLATQDNNIGSAIYADGNFIGGGNLLDFRGGKVLWATSDKKVYVSSKDGVSTVEIGDLATECPSGVYNGIIVGENKAVIPCLVDNKMKVLENGSISDAIAGYTSWNFPNGIATDGEFLYVSRFNAADIVKFTIGGTVEVAKELFYSPDTLDVDGNIQFYHEQSAYPYIPVQKTIGWNNPISIGESSSTVYSISASSGNVIVTSANVYSQVVAIEYSYSGDVIRTIGGANQYVRVLKEKSAPTPPTPPTPQPTVQEISGAKCETMKLPDPNNAEWYNFGELANTITQTGSVEGQRYIQTNVYSGDLLGIDSVRIQNYGDGSSLPPGAIKYPGTDYARVNLNDIASTQIYLQSKRNGALQNFNLVQFHGVNLNGFQSWSASHSMRIDGKLVEGQGLSATGGIASVGLANLKVADTLIVNTPVSGFSGIRVGYARPTEKRWCSTPTNKCEFSYEGGSLVCQGVPVGGLVSGACGVAGSGSVWGSGSCVPLTNASGAIVEVDLPGTYTIVNNPDGTTTKVKATSVKTGKSIFSCVITGDSWYERLGQYLACPFTQIIPNLWDSIVSPIESVKEGIKPISTSGTGGSGLVGAGVNTGSTNPIINGFYGAGETFASDNSNPIPRLVKLLIACVAIFCVVAVVATIVSITKN